jgi:serine/threonine-protein kinase
VKVVLAGLEPVESLAARWRREVLLARKVSHGGICRVHDVAVHRDGEHELLLVTMERVKGGSLQARLRSGGVPLEDALTIGGQIGAALDAAHALGVLHRDVKPDNILIEQAADGGPIRAVLTDFGLARDLAVATRVSHPGRVSGTAGYLAPELLRGEAPSARSDLYAFAIVLRTLVGSAMPSLSEPVQVVFARALSAEPAVRFESAAAFMSALTIATTPRSRRRIRARVAAAGALIAAMALFGLGVRIYIWAPATIGPASQVLLTPLVNGTTQAELDGR